jgi:hypothetical protein
MVPHPFSFVLILSLVLAMKRTVSEGNNLPKLWTQRKVKKMKGILTREKIDKNMSREGCHNFCYGQTEPLFVWPASLYLLMSQEGDGGVEGDEQKNPNLKILITGTDVLKLLQDHPGGL